LSISNNNQNRIAGSDKKWFGLPFPWVITVMGALLLFVAYSYNYVFAVFYKPIADDFGWSRAVVSVAYTICSVAAALLIVPMGYWADRYGPRRVILPCVIISGISMMAAAKITNLWELYLFLGVGVGIGRAGPFVCGVSTIAKWHDKKRGLALGIASMGTGISSIVFPLVATSLMKNHDWRFASFVIGIIILVIGIPVAIVVRNPPETEEQKTFSRKMSKNGLLDGWKVLPRLLKNPAFLTIIMMFITMYTGSQMIVNHLVNYATDIGITALAAAAMMSLMGIAGTAGRLGMAAISDRIGAKRDAAVCCILLIISIFLLMSRIPALMWTATVPFGIGFGGIVPLQSTVMAERVEPQDLSQATGGASMGSLIGSALGPWLGGIIFDATGSYLLAFSLAAAFLIAAFVIIMRLSTAKIQMPE